MPDDFNLPPRPRLREIYREESNRSRLLALYMIAILAVIAAISMFLSK
jgi:hypothetical protein